MTENLHTAFTVLAVGMVTVFTILSLVVLTGKLLIAAVNKFAPAPKALSKKRSKKSLSKTLAGKEKETIAALVAAVEAVTGGQGKITSIEKVSTK